MVNRIGQSSAGWTQGVLYCLLNIAKDRPERRSFLYGRSEVIRTPGILLPNQARYQLRYTRIFNFCHDTTARGKNKDFSVCGHLCGQSRFYTAFSNRGKSRKRRRRKALRRFASLYPGYNHGTPKSALQRFRPLLSAAAQTWVSLNRSGINDCRITTRCCPEVRSPIAPVVLWV